LRAVRIKEDVTSVNNSRKDNIRLYPNPVKVGEHLFIGSDTEILDWKIIHPTGKIIMEKSFRRDPFVDTSDLSAGYYSVLIYLQNDVVSKQFVVH